ncbi:endonuclease/exonuclease/phosphatase family protein [Sphingobacterium shayense]|uniref:endonuclease/exonuclease/phosphatase family protein n=1 Tax=Sphingobacterium shayense TaxID=626343 RepID=UPI00155716EC|nr:endonuclease/exonuclease/phosphatase family protein [Sphingobacterium shayense]NQD72124.1 endonuclease/exonuclease/phosphatase family protein [Sphingobacterium shayense]
MEIITIVFSCILILLSVLPFVQNQHWVFRVPEFAKLQILVLQVAAVITSFLYINDSVTLWLINAVQLALMIYHVYIFIRYTKFWKATKRSASKHNSSQVKIISCNIYQFNDQYERFIQLIREEKPHLFLTMESDSNWEKALRVLEDEYPNQQKVTLDNTYGMHLYTKLKVRNIKTHYFVADDLPSIEAELETDDGYRFVFFGVHPPPPSPTEEENSKERDGDLLSIAKKVRGYKLPVLVTGDFNNVAWAKSSILFKKTSELIDARIGRGILATFHAKYWFFRVPLDLVFHCPDIFIDKLFIYPSVGSDHFPMGCSFHINKHDDQQEEEVDELDRGEMQEVNELIEEGVEEESENRDS